MAIIGFPEEDLIPALSQFTSDEEKRRFLTTQAGMGLGEANALLTALAPRGTPGTPPNMLGGNAPAGTSPFALEGLEDAMRNAALPPNAYGTTAPLGTSPFAFRDSVSTPTAPSNIPVPRSNDYSMFTQPFGTALQKASASAAQGNFPAAQQAVADAAKQVSLPGLTMPQSQIAQNVTNFASGIRPVTSLVTPDAVNKGPVDTGEVVTDDTGKVVTDTNGKVATGDPDSIKDVGKIPGGKTPLPPTSIPFKYTPSRTTDPNQARQLAGVRAGMQVNPQVTAKQQQQKLALQGLQMMRERLQQGVDQTRQTVTKQVPVLFDKARRMLNNAGLTESGGTPGAVERISQDALDQIAQEAERSNLQARQEEQRIGLENRGTDAEIAALRGQFDIDDEGSFTGSLVDSLMQEIIDKNAEFTLREKQLALQENQIMNDLQMARYSAETAASQGDRNAAIAWQQVIAQREQAANQLTLQRDQLGEERRRWDAGEQQRAATLNQVTEQTRQSKELFPQEQELNDLKIENERLTQTLNGLKIKEAQLDAEILNDPNIGRKMTAKLELDSIKQQARLVESQITENNARAASYSQPKPGEKPPDYTSTYGPLASALINQAKQAEAIGDTETADQLYSQAMETAKQWKQGTSTATPNPNSALNSVWNTWLGQVKGYFDPYSDEVMGVDPDEIAQVVTAITNRWWSQMDEGTRAQVREYLSARGLDIEE